MQTGFLTTHVLDTARGSPAGGLHITLFRLDNRDYKAVSSAVTNEDGRTDNPIPVSYTHLTLPTILRV